MFAYLAPASFDMNDYGKFQDQECPSGSQWHSCKFTDPPFMGCCTSDPCSTSAGCPVGDLTAGFLSTNPGVAADILPSSAVTMSSQTSPTASRTNSEATTTTTAQPANHTSRSAVIGSTIGGIAAVIITLASIVFLVYRTISRRRQQAQTSFAVTHGFEKAHDGADMQYISELAPLSQNVDRLSSKPFQKPLCIHHSKSHLQLPRLCPYPRLHITLVVHQASLTAALRCKRLPLCLLSLLAVFHHQNLP